MSEPYIQPCPFCGMMGASEDKYSYFCMFCSAKGPQADKGDEESKRLAWNNRPFNPEHLKLGERLRNQAESLRTKPTPLSELIPLLQKAADALQRKV